MGDESPLALNLGADFVGVVVTYIIFNLILDKIEEARIKEYDRFDLRRFVRDMNDVTDEVRILSTWTDLLKSDTIKPKFLDATRGLIKRGPTVKILLLDPYSIAAAQREKEIGLAARRRGEAPDERDSVQSVIRRNLRDLDAFRATLTADERERLQVRIYDATQAIRLLTQDDTLARNTIPLTESGSNVTARGFVSIKNSIIANEVGSADCSFSLPGAQDAGYNLDSGSSCGFDTVIHSFSNTDPRLGSLANNGGPTDHGAAAR